MKNNRYLIINILLSTKFANHAKFYTWDLMNINIDVNIDKDPNNIYKILWDKHEIVEKLPIYLNTIKTYDFYEFEKNLLSILGFEFSSTALPYSAWFSP